jgi:hypothetical protein
MAGAEALGNQVFDRPAEELVAGVAEEPLGLAIDQDDAPVPVDHDHGVGRRLEQAAELRLEQLGLPPVGEVRHVPEVGGDRDAAPGAAHPPQGGAHEDRGAALLAPAGLERPLARLDRPGDLPAGLLRLAGGDDQLEDRAAESFRGRVAEEDFGAAVPGEDLALGRKRDERAEELLDERAVERRIAAGRGHRGLPGGGRAVALRQG